MLTPHRLHRSIASAFARAVALDADPLLSSAPGHHHQSTTFQLHAAAAPRWWHTAKETR